MVKVSVKSRKRTLLDFAGFEAHSNVQNLAKRPKVELKKPSERKSDKKAVCRFLVSLHTTTTDTRTTTLL